MARRRKNASEVNEKEENTEGEFTAEKGGEEYTEGEFTPTVVETTSENLDVTYSTEVGEYTKVGTFESLIDEEKEVKHVLVQQISSYAEKVGERLATQLAQRLLRINETGIIDDMLITAFNQIGNKTDFINDYKNLQK
jgi:hypothetical protein